MDYVFITKVTLACNKDKNKQIFTVMIHYVWTQEIVTMTMFGCQT